MQSQSTWLLPVQSHKNITMYIAPGGSEKTPSRPHPPGSRPSRFDFTVIYFCKEFQNNERASQGPAKQNSGIQEAPQIWNGPSTALLPQLWGFNVRGRKLEQKNHGHNSSTRRTPDLDVTIRHRHEFQMPWIIIAPTSWLVSLANLLPTWTSWGLSVPCGRSEIEINFRQHGFQWLARHLNALL